MARLAASTHFLASILLALGPSAALAQGENPDPELDAARRALAESTEPEVNRGADACVKRNSPAAVVLLLEVLRRTSSPPGHLPPAHYRDIAWGALGRITDPYARMRVEQELRESKDQSVRQWCAEMLGI